ncbi:MAG: hypothetical protein GC206_09950 [Alphaproteobacteria bacterium]|nr:hypothetical protein [Alphaproteobacteria bacterium]
MATPADVRRAALALPGAHEVQDRHGIWFNVGKKTFIVCWGDAWVFKLPKPRQELLFEARPEIFTPFRAGAMLWSTVDIAKLSRAETRHFVTEAWTTIVPKKRARTLAPPS